MHNMVALHGSKFSGPGGGESDHPKQIADGFCEVAAAPDAVSGEIFSSSTPSLIQSPIAVFISTEW